MNHKGEPHFYRCDLKAHKLGLLSNCIADLPNPPGACIYWSERRSSPNAFLTQSEGYMKRPSRHQSHRACQTEPEPVQHWECTECGDRGHGCLQNLLQHQNPCINLDDHSLRIDFHSFKTFKVNYRWERERDAHAIGPLLVRWNGWVSVILIDQPSNGHCFSGNKN